MNPLCLPFIVISETICETPPERNFATMQTEKAEVYSATYVWNRVYFYAGLVFLRSIGEIAVGSIVHQHLSSDR